MQMHIIGSITMVLASVTTVLAMHIPEMTPRSTSIIKPSTKATTGHGLAKRVDCNDAVNNEPQYDCDGRPHEANADGTCGSEDDWGNSDVSCAAYCEVKRTTWLGPHENAPGEFGVLQSKGQAISIEEGHETTITTGFSIGGDGTWEDAVGLGASFQFSVSETTSYTFGRDGDKNPLYRSRWVYWPLLTETCGDVTSKRLVHGISGGGFVGVGYSCEGDPSTTINVCSTGQVTDDYGHAILFWELAYYDDDGNLAPMEDQSTGFQDNEKYVRT
ncbi:hypothetical protein GGR57DRAFT_518915 [Xylariaceae sp. FL1272]|nr:hypothetical protein GGR57DRAFT_518915 [Xylariaceae sp. FL1272]